jgi:hypothetical protein
VGEKGATQEALIGFYRARRGRGGDGQEQWPSMPWRVSAALRLSRGRLIEVRRKWIDGRRWRPVLYGALKERIEGRGAGDAGETAGGAAVASRGGARGRGWRRQVGPACW